MKVYNDILTSIGQHGIVTPILMTLSAAVDTIGSGMLSFRMESTLGIKEPALNWLCSYLSEQTIQVQIDKLFSTSQEILRPVPQGSVLRPQFFLVHIIP